MSTHTFMLADPRRANDIVTACGEHGRRPTLVQAVTGNTLEMTFDPDLTAQEEADLADLVVAYGSIFTIAEWGSIKADAAGLKAYLGVASPTAAQTAAATKAIIRVLATIIRS